MVYKKTFKRRTRKFRRNRRTRRSRMQKRSRRTRIQKRSKYNKSKKGGTWKPQYKTVLGITEAEYLAEPVPTQRFYDTQYKNKKLAEKRKTTITRLRPISPQLSREDEKNYEDAEKVRNKSRQQSPKLLRPDSSSKPPALTKTEKSISDASSDNYNFVPFDQRPFDFDS